MWPFKNKKAISTQPEDQKLEMEMEMEMEMEIHNPIVWVDFNKEKPPISHDDILIRNEKGTKLIVRYLSGDCWGGDLGFYFHDDRRVKYFKTTEWMKIPD